TRDPVKLRDSLPGVIASLILASASPRRAEILRTLGIPFTVRPADVAEDLLPGETAEAAAIRLADAKAAAAAARDPGRWVLAADPLVFLDGAVLGKPRDDAESREMLSRLAGREHNVVTAVSLRRDREPARTASVVSRVRFAPMSREEIAWYVATGEP